MESQEKGKKEEGRGGETQIVRAASVIAGSTLISRILGFVRDMAFATVIGAGTTADAFYAVYRIPNFLRELMAEGSMSAGFIPVFVEYQTQRPREETRAFVRSVFTFLSIILLVIVGLGMLFTPQILFLIAPGFAERPDQFQLAADLTRIMFPFLLFISFAALTMGILNSTRHFGPPAISSALANAVMILSILYPFFGMTPVFSAAVGVVAGGVLQWAIQLPDVYKEGFSLSFRRPIFPLHPGLKKMLKLLFPVTISLSVTQVNILVSTRVASTLAEGSVTFLYYGMRLIHFPLGVFGVALATALLPTLSSQAVRGDLPELRRSVSFGWRLIFFVTVPAMLGLIFLKIPIVQLLFEHGAFDRIATEGVAQAVLYYAVGLWAFSGVRVVTPVFYAMQDTKTPVVISVLAMVLNIVLIFILSGPLQYKGLALATSLAAIFNFSMLFILLRKKIGRLDIRHILRSHGNVVLASCCMLPLILWIAGLPVWETSDQIAKKSFLLGIAIAGAVFLYSMAHALLKSEEWDFLKGFIKTRARPKRRA